MRPTRAERLTRVQEAATRHIMERGFDRVSVNELADDLGMSVGGLYRYIQTKSDLLVMACETIYGGLRAQLAEVATGTDRELPEKLQLMMRAYFDECVRNRDQILLMYREYRHLPEEAGRQYQERELGIVGVFADLISAGIRRGVFGQVDAQVVAQDIVFLGHLPAIKGWALRNTAPDALADEQIALVLARVLA